MVMLIFAILVYCLLGVLIFYIFDEFFYLFIILMLFDDFWQRFLKLVAVEFNLLSQFKEPSLLTGVSGSISLGVAVFFCYHLVVPLEIVYLLAQSLYSLVFVPYYFFKLNYLFLLCVIRSVFLNSCLTALK